MLCRNVNRWAVVDYLHNYGIVKKDHIFIEIAEGLDQDERPTGLSKTSEETLRHLIENCDEWKSLQTLTLEIVDILRSNDYDNADIYTFCVALLMDCTERDLEWEKHHNAPKKSEFHIDFMSMNPQDPDYFKAKRFV